MEPDKKAVSPTCKLLLQPPRLLEGAHSHQKAGVCSKGGWEAGQGVAQEAGNLEDLSACSRHIPRPEFDVAVSKEVHQADLLFLRHDRVRWKTFRYALTVVDVANRYKEAESLTSKTAAEVADGLAGIYKRSALQWPKLLQVDPGREFMGFVNQMLAKSGAVGLTSTGTKAS